MSGRAIPKRKEVEVAESVEAPVQSELPAVKAPKAKAKKAEAASSEVVEAKVTKAKSKAAKAASSSEEETPAKGKTRRAKKDAENAEDNSKRHFRINVNSIVPAIPVENLSANGGRFSGNTPMQAAKKAFTQIARASGQEESSFSFSVVESTSGSSGKEFHYQGSRSRLAEPQFINKAGTQIPINFKNEVKSRKVEGDVKPAAPKQARSKGASKQGRAKAARKEKSPEVVDDEKLEQPAEVVEEDPQPVEPEPATPAKSKSKSKAKSKSA